MQKRLNCTHSHNEATRYYLLQLCKEQRGKKVLAATAPVQASQSSEEFASLSPMMLSTVLQLSLADKRKKKTAKNKMLLGGLSRVYTSLQSTLGLLVAVHIIHEGLPASTQLQLCKDYAKTYAAKVLEVAIHLWHRAHKEKGTKGSARQSKRNTAQVGLWRGLKMLAALYAVRNETHMKAGFFLCGTCRVSPAENMQLRRQMPQEHSYAWTATHAHINKWFPCGQSFRIVH